MSDEYHDFEKFLSKVLRTVLQEKSADVDCWLGAVAGAFGGIALRRLASSTGGGLAGPIARSGLGTALGIGRGIGIGRGLSMATGVGMTLLPILGAVSAATALAMLYRNNAQRKKGEAISRRLQSAKAQFNEYANSSLSDDDKKKLIDDLYDSLIAEGR